MTRWITDMLGTAPYYDCEKTVSTHDIMVLDIRELVDNRGNNPNDLIRKIQSAAKAIQDGRKVVVCCDKGISRSNAIALGVLMLSGMSYGEALKVILEKVGPSNLNLALLHDVRSLFQDHHESPDREARTNILVTGSSGFIGRALVKALKPEYNMLCPGREMSLTQDLPLLDLYVRENAIHQIVHLAHPRMRNSVSSMAEAIAMMKNILEVCRLGDVRLVYLSSLVVFSGYTSEPMLVARSSLEPWPRGTYAETKHLCEELVQAYRRTYGLKATVLRGAGVYGSNMERSTLLSKFFEAAMRGATIYTHRYRNGLPTFDFLHLDDLIDAMRQALLIKPDMVLNLGTGEPTSTYDLARLIVSVCASASGVKTIDIDDDTYHVVADPSEAKRYLDWEAKIDLETGIMGLRNSFKQPIF
jgi:UDP-glucuronate decarboxylase